MPTFSDDSIQDIVNQEGISVIVLELDAPGAPTGKTLGLLITFGARTALERNAAVILNRVRARRRARVRGVQTPEAKTTTMLRNPQPGQHVVEVASPLLSEGTARLTIDSRMAVVTPAGMPAAEQKPAAAAPMAPLQADLQTPAPTPTMPQAEPAQTIQMPSEAEPVAADAGETTKA